MSDRDMTIIGGGWSVRAIDLGRLAGQVIAVNDSARLAPRWDYAVSMDRLWTEARFDEIVARTIQRQAGEVWLRRSAVQNLGSGLHELTRVKVFECDHTTNVFSEDEGRLNGTNSGACALNLAFQLRPRRLFLLGFDMNRSPEGQAYWYPPYPWTAPTGGTSDNKYRAWANQFELAALAFQAIGCEVFNVSPESAIASFQKISPAQYLGLQR